MEIKKTRRSDNVLQLTIKDRETGEERILSGMNIVVELYVSSTKFTAYSYANGEAENCKVVDNKLEVYIPSHTFKNDGIMKASIGIRKEDSNFSDGYRDTYSLIVDSNYKFNK